MFKDNLAMETHFGSSLDFSPNKSLKTSPTSTPTTRKGKEKITEVTDEEELSIEEVDEENGASINSKTCGICLAEDGLAIQGFIDSCSHYFCFVCIMEWAKVESRCPTCKQRFGSIRRPPRSGVFEQERVVNVPLRDQVYDPRGNTTRGPPDPYAQISCFECHSSEDECLLLLCDLCDSAAHTYCVGLGHTVPEGDWYCHDCSIMRSEQARSQVDMGSCNQELSDSSRVGQCDASVSLYEIVQEERGINGSQVNSISSCPRPEPENSVFSQESQENSSSVGNTEPKSTVFSQESQGKSSSVGNTPVHQHARTLRRCRNVHSHIKKLRENWNSLRNGSVTFSSSALESDCASGSRKWTDKVVTSRSSSQSSSFCFTNIQTIADKKNSSESLNSRESEDVDRAWKMLKMAQVAKGLCRDAGTRSRMSTKKNIVEKLTFGNSSSQMLKTKPFEGIRCNTASMGSHRNSSLDLAYTEHQPLKCGKQKVDAKLSPKEPILQQSPVGTSLSEDHILKHSMVGNSFVKGKQRSPMSTCFGKQQRFRHPDSFKGSNVSPLVSTPNIISPGESNVSCCSKKPVAASQSQIGPAEVPGFLDKNFTEVLRKSDGVKGEIQSLVKLNLKLLTRDKQLGVDKFKEVARSATHTILAACGVEHSKSHARSFPSVVCRHIGRTEKVQLSNLMPNLCRECFYLFVKEVVSSLMGEML